jgi:hypothetical protein
MCRSIHALHNFEPPADSREIREAALQYVRKISGMRVPSAANGAAFDSAVDEIATATERLLGDLVATTPPRDREADRARARARWEKRLARERAAGPG